MLESITLYSDIKLNTLCPNGLTDNCSGGFEALSTEAQKHIHADGGDWITV